MIRHIYVPFVDPGIQQQSKGLDIPGQIIRRHYYQPGRVPQLKWVTRVNQLYVVGHGATGADGIFDNTGNMISVADLAQRLVDEGVSKSHQVIKLWACEGGAGGQASTANKFLGELRKLGFEKVVVLGYLPSITNSWKGHKRGVVENTIMEDAGDGNGPQPKVVKDYTLHASEVRVAFS